MGYLYLLVVHCHKYVPHKLALRMIAVFNYIYGQSVVNAAAPRLRMRISLIIKIRRIREFLRRLKMLMNF